MKLLAIHFLAPLRASFREKLTNEVITFCHQWNIQTWKPCAGAGWGRGRHGAFKFLGILYLGTYSGPSLTFWSKHEDNLMKTIAFIKLPCLLFRSTRQNVLYKFKNHMQNIFQRVDLRNVLQSKIFAHLMIVTDSETWKFILKNTSISTVHKKLRGNLHAVLSQHHLPFLSTLLSDFQLFVLRF